MTTLRYHDGQPVRLNDLFTAPRWGTCRVVSFDRPNRCATARNVRTGEVFDLLGSDTFGESDLIERYDPAAEAARLAAAARSLLPHETERAVIDALKDSPVWREADEAIGSKEDLEIDVELAEERAEDAEERAARLERRVREWEGLYEELPRTGDDDELESFRAIADRMAKLYATPTP